MRIDIITIFPDYLAPLRQSLLGKAVERGIIDIQVHDLRQWTEDVHHTVDDAPYGGTGGMVMMPEPWGRALDAVLPQEGLSGRLSEATRLIVPTPAGKLFTQRAAQEYAECEHLVFACGRYEGIDQRVVDDASRRMRVDEVSIGDYVLAGGEVASMVMVEAACRLIPGVVGNALSVVEDSHADGLLEGPSYTRPAVWRGLEVPDVLRSGDHAAIAAWRREQSLARTGERRPDLLSAPESREA